MTGKPSEVVNEAIGGAIVFIAVWIVVVAATAAITFDIVVIVRVALIAAAALVAVWLAFVFWAVWKEQRDG